jgi:hypothetical protein
MGRAGVRGGMGAQVPRGFELLCVVVWPRAPPPLPTLCLPPQFYSSGVLTCACGTDIDHAVLAVGYGTDSGSAYFKVRTMRGWVRPAPRNCCWGKLTGSILPCASSADVFEEMVVCSVCGGEGVAGRGSGAGMRGWSDGNKGGGDDVAWRSVAWRSGAGRWCCLSWHGVLWRGVA